VAACKGGGDDPRASAARLRGERARAESGAIDSRQLSAGFADYLADARQGAADNPAAAA
jgi:hypothetical protein